MVLGIDLLDKLWYPIDLHSGLSLGGWIFRRQGPELICDDYHLETVHVKYNSGSGYITKAPKGTVTHSDCPPVHHHPMMRNHTRHRAEDDHAMQCNLLGVNPAALLYCTLVGKCLTCFSYRVFIAHPLSLPNYLQASYGGFWNLPSIVLVAKQEATLVPRCSFQPFCSCVGFPLLPPSPRSRPVLQILSSSPSITPHSYHVLVV